MCSVGLVLCGIGHHSHWQEWNSLYAVEKDALRWPFGRSGKPLFVGDAQFKTYRMGEFPGERTGSVGRWISYAGLLVSVLACTRKRVRWFSVLLLVLAVVVVLGSFAMFLIENDHLAIGF
jgi:hypothetical protein